MTENERVAREHVKVVVALNWPLREVVLWGRVRLTDVECMAISQESIFSFEDIRSTYQRAASTDKSAEK